MYVAPFQLKFLSPMGSKYIDVEYIVIDSLIIGSHEYLAQLILLDMEEFDIILGMDWLKQNNILKSCQKCKLIMRHEDREVVVFRHQKLQ